MPKTYDAFTELLEGRCEVDQATIIRRIIVCHSIKLKAENRNKMERFYAILVKHMRTIAMQAEPPFKLIDAITRELFDLSPSLEEAVAPVFQKRLAIMNDTFTRSLAVHQDGEQLASKWPSRGDLFFMQLASLIFPVTDHRHTVITPLLVFMARTLSHCPVFHIGDVQTGVFLCNMLLGFLAPSQRFCPEVIRFLLDLLRTTTDCNDSEAPPRLKPVQGLLVGSAKSKLKPQPVLISSLGVHKASDEQSTVDTLAMLYRVLGAAVDACVLLFSAPELLDCVLCTLKAAQKKIPVEVASLSEGLTKRVSELASEVRSARKPLKWQTPKPKMIRMQNPRFDADFNPERSLDPEKERVEAKKNKRRVTREIKHAKRELYQDSLAMAEVRDGKRAAKDKLKQDKMNRHLAELESQQNNYKETGGIMHDGGKGKPKRDRKKKN